MNLPKRWTLDRPDCRDATRKCLILTELWSPVLHPFRSLCSRRGVDMLTSRSGFLWHSPVGRVTEIYNRIHCDYNSLDNSRVCPGAATTWCTMSIRGCATRKLHITLQQLVAHWLLAASEFQYGDQLVGLFVLDSCQL